MTPGLTDHIRQATLKGRRHQIEPESAFSLWFWRGIALGLIFGLALGAFL